MPAPGYRSALRSPATRRWLHRLAAPLVLFSRDLALGAGLAVGILETMFAARTPER
jgi:hypothetical protein